MLTLTRRTGQALLLFPEPSVSPDMTIGEFFKDGPVTVMVSNVSYAKGKGQHHVRIGVEAPKELKVLREELDVHEAQEESESE